MIGEPPVIALQAVGSVMLYQRLVPEHGTSTFWTPFWHPSWPLLFTGLAVITFARIMRVGVDMREDLEGTV